jgi:hypothetical protein
VVVVVDTEVPLLTGLDETEGVVAVEAALTRTLEKDLEVLLQV